MATGFTKKEVDIEALMAQAAALEEEEKAAAAKKGAKKEKKPKKEKVKKEKVKKEKPKKERVKKEKPKKEKKSSSGTKDKKARKKHKKKGGDALEPRNIFGVRLSELELEEGEIPDVFAELVTVLEGHATETQGLFRKTAPVSEVSALIDRFHAGEDMDWNDIEDKHLVGGVLMAFLLRLPEPLITFTAYDKLINIVSSDKEREEQLTEIKKVIKELPELNYNMLEYLLDFLDTMTRDSDDNLMTSENLAICFGPGLLRREEENLGQLMKESSMVTNILTVLVDQYGFFFRDEGIDEDQTATPGLKRAATDFSAFINVALTGLADVSKQLSDIVKDLEWEKLWQPQPLAHLAVLEDILTKILSDELSALNEETVKNEIADTLSYHLKDISAESASSYCSTMRDKFKGHHSTVEDTIIVLNQQSGERDVVLQACKVSKLAAALLRIMKPNIAKDLDVSVSDVKDVKSSVPGIKKELNKLKAELDMCENYHFAAVLSRVIRAVQKGLKERIKTPIAEVDLSVPATTPTAKDKLKIENLQDALEFSFPVCIKILNTIVAELDDPEKKSEAMRSSDLLTEVESVLKKFRALKLSPKLSGSSGGSAPPPVAAHPKASGGSSAPPPVAAHPKSSKGSKPPPVAAHPKASKGSKPPPVAAHPKASGGSRPPPIVAHPKATGASRPPPMAAHPKATGASRPPPVAAHPKAAGGSRPPPMAAHPKATGASRPPPMAAHPRASKPPPMAAHPRAGK